MIGLIIQNLILEKFWIWVNIEKKIIMRILWITNILLPPLCEALNLPIPVVGGWMYSSAAKLIEDNSITLAVATVYQGKEYKDIQIGSIRYFLLPLNGSSMLKYHKKLEHYWHIVKNDFIPDVIHIHGTEYPHGLAYVRACGAKNVVVSIQGLLSCYYHYYYYGLTKRNILQNITFRDSLRQDDIFQQKNKMKRRSKYEKELLASVNHIIGRTSWDKAHVWAINPNAIYHYCNETLRQEFYNHTWNYENCEKHTIFISQAGYPIKGLHMMMKALQIVKQFYPDVKLYVAGDDITKKTWYRLSGYGKIIKNMIHKYSLKGHVIFTGPLDEKAICHRYLASNLFVCPSSIENSPNSLGEAQLLGVPYLAAYVGGVYDLTKNHGARLYRFEEFEMLAYKICESFNSDRIAVVDDEVRMRHNAFFNKSALVSIYNTIIQ